MSSASADNAQDFIASLTWQGSKAGYYFGTNNGKTGYYKDDKSGLKIGANDPPKKRRRTVQIAEDQNEVRIIASGDKLLEEAERKQAADGQAVVVELTAKGIRTVTSALHKVITQNALQRAEFGKDAQHYIASELALYEHISALQSVAANVTLYKHVIATPKSGESLIQMLIELLTHDNADVGASVVALFLEWVDPVLMTPDGGDGDSDERRILVIEMASRVLNDAWDTIVSNLSRFQPIASENEGEDPSLKGMENVLSLMENLLEIDLAAIDGIVESKEPLTAAAYMAKETPIVPWLVQHLDSETSGEEFRGRCLELLAFVAQKEDVHHILPDWSNLRSHSANVIENDDGSKPPESVDAIESMLQAIGKFRKKQPANDDQVEYLENACMALSSCISFSTPNLKAFMDGQGIELVVRCLKERVHAGGASFKLLDFGIVAPGADVTVHRQACEHLVKVGGLKYLFPVWMGTRLPKSADLATATSKKAALKEKRQWQQTMERQTIRSIYAMTRFLTDDSPEEAKARLAAKFLNGSADDENVDTSKCDRLVELLLKYDKKSRTAEYNFYRYVDDDADEDDPTIQLAALQAKLDGGGDLFHRLGGIAGFLCVSSKTCHERILSQLQLQQSGIGLVKVALEEFSSVLQLGEQQEQLKGYLSQI